MQTIITLIYIRLHALIKTRDFRKQILCTSKQQQRQPLPTNLFKLILLISIYASLITCCNGLGYSYTSFVGPVSGPEDKVYIQDLITGGSRVDYVGKPEYQFSYGVEDGNSRVLQNHKETRSGDAVQGVYSVFDPDGTLRVVKYSADDRNGFTAEVSRNGVTTIHGDNGGYAAQNSLPPLQPDNYRQPEQSNQGRDYDDDYEDNNNKNKNTHVKHKDYENENEDGDAESDEETISDDVESEYEEDTSAESHSDEEHDKSAPEYY